ncbi:MAG TPA: Clp protease N-terminal domain-containing protein [Solirubrobacteraceae bacterium]|nr:Clp protease N-terminal domain-containing protein [Solirubrobacteraceae bacterium]
MTERARHVVVLGQEEARALRHHSIGTGHILLGLLREEEGMAARVLEKLAITVERVRERVVRMVGSGEEATTGQIPFTERAKKVLELALREALSLGHNYIGTEHILLGLIAENEGVAFRTRPDPGSDLEEREGVAVRILHDFDVDAETIRAEVIRMLSSPEARAERARAEVRYVSSETSIHVDPSAIVRRLLMSAAARALDDGRSEIEVADLLLALTRDEATSRLLASLGVDVTAVRDTLEREAPPAE